MAFIVIASSALAQDEEFSAKQLLTDLKARMNLTEDQIVKIQPMLKKHGEALRALVEKYTGHGYLGMRSMKKEMERLRDDLKKRLEPILTVEQMKELDAFYEQLRQEANQRIQDRIIAALTKRLNVTEDQAKHVQAILAENIAKRSELLEKYRGQGRNGFNGFRKENHTSAGAARNFSTGATDSMASARKIKPFEMTRKNVSKRF